MRGRGASADLRGREENDLGIGRTSAREDAEELADDEEYTSPFVPLVNALD